MVLGSRDLDSMGAQVHNCHGLRRTASHNRQGIACTTDPWAGSGDAVCHGAPSCCGQGGWCMRDARPCAGRLVCVVGLVVLVA